ncbi:MAG TPA: MFS transporter, partial [Rhabdaerophilum sp.]|nr:MFS transporter [Rhabdaerophilum sp.]
MTASPFRILAAAIALVTLVGISLSVSAPLLALEMERWGISATISGMTITTAGIGTVLAAPLVPRFALRLGVPLLLGAALAVSALAMIAFYLFPGILWWTLFRFVLGATIGVIFSLSEYWIAAAAPPARRGLVMAIYATALYAGFAAGPMLLSTLGTTGPFPYLATVAIILVGFGPLLLAARVAPRIDEQASAPVLRFVLAAPTATFAALMFGAVETAVVTLLPVHNVRLGFAEKDAALLLSAFALGNVLFQIPIGYISDLMDRRRLLAILATVSTLLSAAILHVQGIGFWPFALVLFVLGGVSGAIYNIGLAHLGSRFEGVDLASANAAFVMLYSVGLMVGPPLIGFGMEVGGR